MKKKNPLLYHKRRMALFKGSLFETSQKYCISETCQSDVIISTRIFHNTLIGKYARPDIVKITGDIIIIIMTKNNDSVISSCKRVCIIITDIKRIM